MSSSSLPINETLLTASQAPNPDPTSNPNPTSNPSFDLNHNSEATPRSYHSSFPSPTDNLPSPSKVEELTHTIIIENLDKLSELHKNKNSSKYLLSLCSKNEFADKRIGDLCSNVEKIPASESRVKIMKIVPPCRNVKVPKDFCHVKKLLDKKKGIISNGDSKLQKNVDGNSSSQDLSIISSDSSRSSSKIGLPEKRFDCSYMNSLDWIEQLTLQDDYYKFALGETQDMNESTLEKIGRAYEVNYKKLNFKAALNVALKYYKSHCDSDNMKNGCNFLSSVLTENYWFDCGAQVSMFMETSKSKRAIKQFYFCPLAICNHSGWYESHSEAFPMSTCLRKKAFSYRSNWINHFEDCNSTSTDHKLLHKSVFMYIRSLYGKKFVQYPQYPTVALKNSASAINLHNRMLQSTSKGRICKSCGRSDHCSKKSSKCPAYIKLTQCPSCKKSSHLSPRSFLCEFNPKNQKVCRKAK